MSEEIKNPEVPTPEKKEEVQKPVEKSDDEKTAEELKAEAEAIEAEIKEKKGYSKDEEIRANQLRRLQKAREKLDSLNNEPADDKPKGKSDEIATEDLVELRVNNIDRDSDKAKILERYVKGGIVKNYKEALQHVGVKAEIEALEKATNAKTVVDENDTEENRLKTKKEIVAGYRASGEVPDDPELQKAIVEDNLSKMTQL